MKIVKENKQMVYNITQDQRDTLKKVLTYDNPAYKQAKRYSRCKYISIPPHLTYYTEKSVSNGDGTRSKMIEVPIGVDVEKILEVKAEIEDRRAEIKVEFPKFELDLRKDQQIAMEHYLSEQHKVIFIILGFPISLVPAFFSNSFWLSLAQTSVLNLNHPLFLAIR